MLKYVTRDREAGNVIETFKTQEDAEKAILEYEEDDKNEGIYTKDFYEVSKIWTDEFGKTIAE